MAINRDNFWKPIIMDADGYYVTQGQLDFFLLRSNGYRLVMKFFEKGHVERADYPELCEFGSFVESCKIYNVIRDITKVNPRSSKMYWDSDDQTMKFTYPENGTIDLMLRSIIEGEDNL